MIQFFLFTTPVVSGWQEFDISLVDKTITVSSFGFKSNASFSLFFYPPMQLNVKFHLRNEMSDQSISNVLYCYDPKMNTNYYWNETILQEGIYTLLIQNNELIHRKMKIITNFKNGDSFLDERDKFMPILYLVLATIYFTLWIIWVSNGYLNSNFRIALHSYFGFLTVIKAISLYMSRITWYQLDKQNSVNEWIKLLEFILETVYYTLLLYVNGIVSSGFCTFRIRILIQEKLETFASSLFLGFSIVLMGRIKSFNLSLIMIILICFGIMWYAKKGILSLIISYYLLERMKRDPIIRAKINLSRDFVWDSCILLLLTIFIYSFCLGIELRTGVCVVVLEIGLLAESLLQQKFFLLRKTYSGEIQTVKKLPTHHVTNFIEPRHTQITFLTLSAHHQESSIHSIISQI